MLHEFINEHRQAIVVRCQTMLGAQLSLKPTDEQIATGVPLFLDQLIETLRLGLPANPELNATASKNGNELLSKGFTASQVVHNYGDICQAITGLAVDMDAPITNKEFRILNQCLDDATASAVTEYGRCRDVIVSDESTQRLNERLGAFAHDLRNVLTRAQLSFDALKSGRVGIGGSTGAVLGRSLQGMGDLIARSLADVRLTAGVVHRERVLIAELVEDVEIYGSLEASARSLQFSVGPIEPSLAIDADRQILTSVLTNLLHNACKFTRPKGSISLQVRTTADRIFLDVADQCGGLPPGKIEELFRPFEQRGSDRTGVGLGLVIARRGAEAHGGKLEARSLPGIGCVFTLELPR